jgi:hypothetical protein
MSENKVRSLISQWIFDIKKIVEFVEIVVHDNGAKNIF